MNVYYKSHIERMRINMCNLERTNIILEMLQLQAYNLEINQEIRDRRSKNNKVFTTVQKKYKVERKKKNKKRKESSNSRRKKDCEMDSR